MSGAANEHLTTVTTAQSEAATLAGEMAAIPQHLTDATAAVTAAINTLIETLGSVAAQSDMATSAANNTVIAAEAHVSAAQAHAATAEAVGGAVADLAQQALVYAQNAQEQCLAASAKAESLTDFLGNLQAVAEHAKTEAVNMVMGILGQIEEAAENAPALVGVLSEAETHINNALNVG